MDPSRNGGSVTVEPPSSISSVDVHRAAEDEEEVEGNADEQVKQQKQIEFPQSYSILKVIESGARRKRRAQAKLNSLLVSSSPSSNLQQQQQQQQQQQHRRRKDQEDEIRRADQQGDPQQQQQMLQQQMQVEVRISCLFFSSFPPNIATKDFVLSGPLILL